MDRADFQAWLDRYVEAWRTNDRDRIAALFTEDAGYSYGPFRDDDLKDRDAILESWLEQPDEPTDWDATYEAWAVDGDRGVAHGLSRYYKNGGTREAPLEYENVFLVEFAADGRCRDFREFFMEPPKQVRQRIDQRVNDAVKAAAEVAEARQLSETAVVG
jgi:uncharacterized protein (TIGR02246 family)